MSLQVIQAVIGKESHSIVKTRSLIRLEILFLMFTPFFKTYSTEEAQLPLDDFAKCQVSFHKFVKYTKSLYHIYCYCIVLQ